MTEQRLRSLLLSAPPAQGPALQAEDLLRRARLRVVRRRQAVLAGAATALLVAGVAFAASNGTHTAQPAGPPPTPCASPFASGEREHSIAFVRDTTLEVSLTIGEHVSVGWAGCDEYGTITSSDPNSDTAPLAGTDSSGHSVPVPHPSGAPFGRPEIDGSYLLRFAAQRVGDVTLKGHSHEGYDGTIVVHVLELPASESSLVSGTVDTSGLTSHPTPEQVDIESMPFNGSVVAVVHDGRFSARVRPGRYHLIALNAAYNDGRVRCTEQDIDVGTTDVTGLTLTCTERR